MESLCANDYRFGPGADCRTLDFTILFSDIFLSFVPGLIYVLYAVPRFVYILPRKSRRLLSLNEIPREGVILLVTRVSLALGLLGANIALAFRWETSSVLGGSYSGLLASIFECLAAAATLALVTIEHFKNARPSQLAALYLLVSVLFVACRMRTLGLISTSLAPFAPLAASLAFRVLLFIALQFSTRTSQVDGARLPPERTAGLVARYLVTWILPLLWRGYRKPLNMEDLGTIDEDLHSLATWNKLSPHWTKHSYRSFAGKTKQPLFRAALAAFAGPLAAPLFPWLIASVATLARPLIIGETVTFVQSHTTGSPQPLSQGWGLVGATVLTYGIFTITNALADVATQRSALALRGALMEALYRKSLVIRTETAREMGAAKASNLMSVDVNAITTTVQAIHSVWTAIVMTGLGLYIIYTQIGISFLASLIGAIIFFALLPIVTRKVGDTRTKWAESTDRRVKFMASVLRHIKAIKLSAYEPSVAKTAIDFRDHEIYSLRKWIKEILIVSIVTNYVSAFLSLLTVATYTLVSLYAEGGNGISTARIFTVISTIALLANPLRDLGQRIGSIVSAWASWKRIEAFLLCEEKGGEVPTTISDIELETKPTLSVEVKLSDADFGVRDKITLLRNINVHLSKPALWMLVGRVGSGKSTLLQSLLGEMDLLKGYSGCRLGTIGYCSQDPWLLNRSIRANITFMCPYDPVWYRQVTTALALDIDMSILSEGDLTLVGNLSGGQKQRVALARAVYGRFDTYVLDDVLSALDATTEAQVFSALFGSQGLLKGKTVIMATNQVYRLPQASYITYLQEGEIAEQGSYEDLLAQDGLLSALISDFSTAKKGSGETKEKEDKPTSDALTEPTTDTRSEKDEQGEQSAKGGVAWSTYGLYLKGMGTTHAVIWFSMIVVTQAIETCTQVYLQAWTTTLDSNSPPSRYGAFLGGYTGMQLGYLFSFCVAIFNAFMYAHPIVSRNLHEWQIRGLLGVSLDYFDSRPVGQMINRFNSDLNMIDMTLPNHAVNVMYTGAGIIGSVILITIAGPYMAAVLFGTALVMAVIQRFYVRAGRELRRLDLTSKSPIYTLFSETIDADGLQTIRAMGAQETCRTMMTQRATASQFPAWLLMVVLKWLELALNSCASVINVLLVLIAVLNRNSANIGILAVALSQAAGMCFNLMAFVVEWTNVEMCITSVERIQEYCELPPQEKRPPTGEEWLQHGSIRFSDLTARYKPELPPAISKISFTIKPGQRVGICGRSGSGKSTLLGVLWRLIDYEDDGGEIMVDGIDIRDLQLTDYRSAMSIVPQDPLLLELSLRANLDPEGLHTDEEIWDALETSHLRAHVETLEGKLDEVMAGDGGVFSRGQRQLLALARALLRQRHILALDEATSSIDAETDAQIQHTIRTFFNDATVLTIAHRISTILDYDIIIVMDQGKIIEMGEPGTLIEQEGAFWRLAVEGGAITNDRLGQGSGS